MGLMDIFSKQFIDVIEWNEAADGILAWRFPMTDQEIQNGAKLTVRESQQALFVNEGKIADLFSPGLYTLNTQTLPVMTSLQNWDKLFQSPFKSDVYFFSTREQIDQRWGTSTPIVIRDQEFGAIRLRAHGVFSYQLNDPKTFFQKISGTRDSYSNEDVAGQLRAQILTSLASYFGNAQVNFLDMAANQQLFSEKLQEALAAGFADYGLTLKRFYVQSISLPEELQAHLDKVTSMKMVGDLGRYAQFQTAESIPLAASNEGGIAGVGAGMGAGLAMAQTMQSAFTANAATPVAAAAAPVAEDPIAALEKLHGLLTKGIITQADFDQKKAELLARVQ